MSHPPPRSTLPKEKALWKVTLRAVLAASFAAIVFAVALTRITMGGVVHVMETEEAHRVGDAVRWGVDKHCGSGLLPALRAGELDSGPAAGLPVILDDLGIFRMKVFGRDTTILWSDERRLVGRRYPDDHGLRRALAGETVASMSEASDGTHVYEDDVARNLIETYVPISSATGEIIGVIEVYRDADELVSGIAHVREILSRSATAVTLLLCLILALIISVGQRQVLGLQEDLRQRGSELEQEKAKLEMIVDGLGVGLCLVDADHRLLWANRLVGAWTGASEGMSWQPAEAAVEGSASPTHPSALAIGSQQERRAERTHLGPDGKRRVLSMIAWPIRDEAGDVTQALELVQDVTENRRVEELAINQERLAALGRVAAGIAHEVGNPLSSISALVQLMQRRRITEIESELETLGDEVERIDGIVRGIGTFVGPRLDTRELVDMDDVVDEALRVAVLDRRWKGFEIERERAPGGLVVLAHGGRLVQVFLNILLNAADAMEQVGQVRIASGVIDGRAQVTFADSGSGLDPGLESRIFEPFFTTKEPGKGTGLGLHVSWNIVTEHLGTIKAGRAPGGGALFTVQLPMAKTGQSAEGV